MVLSLFLSAQTFASESHVSHVFFKEKDQMSPFTIDIVKSNHDYVSYILKMDGEIQKKLSLPVKFESITDQASYRAKISGWAKGTKITSTVVGAITGLFTVVLFETSSPNGSGNPIGEIMGIVSGAALGGLAGYYGSGMFFYSVNERNVVTTLMSSKVINSDKPVILEYDAMEAVDLLDSELKALK